MKRMTLMAALVFAACEGKPVLVGYETPVEVTVVVDGGTRRVFPTSMGDAFAVDPPVTLADTGVSRLTHSFDGAMHLIAWTSQRGLLAVRFDAQGTRLDADPLLLAPPELLRAGVLATPHPAGGFEVFWAGPQFFGGSNTSVPGYGTLYAVRVGRDGDTTLPISFGGSGLGDDFQLHDVGLNLDTLNGVYRALRLAAVRPGGVLLRSLGGAEPGHNAYGPFLDFDPSSRGVFVPAGTVLGELGFTRLGDRDYLATITGDDTARVLELRALTPRADAPAVTNDPGVVVFSTPITRAAVDLRGHTNLSLQAVGGRVVLVWRDSVQASWALSAVSVLPTGADTFDTSPVTTVASGSFGFADVTTEVTGTSLLVGLRGIVSRASDPATPLAVELDPATLLPRSAISASLIANTDITFRGCSWDGAACLVLTGSTSVGPGGGFVVAQRVAPGGSLSALAAEQALPGQVNEQREPVATCGATTCLLVWNDGRELGSVGDARAVRVDQETGLPVEADSLSLFSNQRSYATWSDPAVASTDGGFLTAEGRCSGTDSGATMQLVVRLVPELGELGAPQVVDFPALPCAAWGQVVIATGSDTALVAALQRDGPSAGQLLLAQLGADGVARARPHTLPLPGWAYSSVDAIIVGDHVVLALQVGDSWTTAVLDLAQATPDAVGLAQTCPFESCSASTRRLVNLPGSARVGWVELIQPGFLVNVHDWALTWTELDEHAVPLGAPRTLTGDRGDAYGLQVAADERGLAVLTAQRTFSSEDYTLVFRRFDLEPEAQAPEQGRPVASGIHTRGHALASAGDGQWLTAFATSGATNGNLVTPGGDASRVLGRFVYEAPAP